MLLTLSFLAALAAPAPLGVDDIDTAAPVSPLDDAAPYVVGGKRVKSGDWPDVALVWLSDSLCTGTLIHPKWVLTAGHCVVDGDPSQVVVGLTSFRNLADEGVSRDVKRAVAHPKYERRYWGFDIALIELERPIESVVPRGIASDCLLDLAEGDPVTIVGWGATSEDGNGGGYDLMVGTTEVQTPDCSREKVDGIQTGCDPEARPAGELGAGGNGVDACFGDSGGPLYREVDGTAYIVGVTSRAYMGVPFNEPCGHGGVYTRPDAVLSWIESTIGEPLPRPVCTTPPTASADPLHVAPGKSRAVKLRVDDDGDAWSVVVASPPAHGEVQIDGNDVTYTAADGYKGEDSFTLTVVDDGSATWPDSAPGEALVTVPVTVGGGCGCATSGAPALWALAPLAWAFRRRTSRR